MPNKRSEEVSSLRRWLVRIGGAILLIVVGTALASFWRRPPQMGADDQVFRTVDALFTAVTARDERLVGQCEQRLHASRDAGKLPLQAATHLDRIIAQSRAGHWEPAAQTLYAFMLAQRRDIAAR
jgi:hypothetical protein